MTCPTCSGEGVLKIPTPHIDSQGRKMIIKSIITCQTCKGNGTV